MSERTGADAHGDKWIVYSPYGKRVNLRVNGGDGSIAPVSIHSYDAATLRPLIAALQEALAELEGGVR